MIILQKTLIPLSFVLLLSVGNAQCAEQMPTLSNLQISEQAPDEIKIDAQKKQFEKWEQAWQMERDKYFKWLEVENIEKKHGHEVCHLIHSTLESIHVNDEGVAKICGHSVDSTPAWHALKNMLSLRNLPYVHKKIESAEYLIFWHFIKLQEDAKVRAAINLLEECDTKLHHPEIESRKRWEKLGIDWRAMEKWHAAEKKAEKEE